MGTQGALPATRLPTTRLYAEAASMTLASLTSPTFSLVLSASLEPVFCTIDTSRVPEDHAAEATPIALCKTIKQEMRASGNQTNWRYVAVTWDRRNTNCIVLCNQLYPVKVNSINCTAILDQEGTILPGVLETLGQENEV